MWSQIDFFTDNKSKNSDEKKWITLQTMLPFIQFMLNQKRSRFTNISPNMIMFGHQMREIADLELCAQELDNLKNIWNCEHESYQYVDALAKELGFIYRCFSRDWNHYARFTKYEYDERYQTIKQLERNYEQFVSGAKVVYFVGDKQTTSKKWRQRWSGPWIIIRRINDRTVVIGDITDDVGLSVSVDRVKLYRESEYYSFEEYNRMIEKRMIDTIIDDDNNITLEDIKSGIKMKKIPNKGFDISSKKQRKKIYSRKKSVFEKSDEDYIPSEEENEDSDIDIEMHNNKANIKQRIRKRKQKRK